MQSKKLNINNNEKDVNIVFFNENTTDNKLKISTMIRIIMMITVLLNSNGKIGDGDNT